MKKRYYLSMLSVIPLFLIFDSVYFILHQSLVMFLMQMLVHLAIFGLLNYWGMCFLYRPIDAIFTENVKNEQGISRINKLSWYSAGWIFTLGLFYVALVFVITLMLPSDFEGYNMDKFPPLLWLTIIPSGIYFFALFPSFITYFLINDLKLDIKEKIHKRFNMNHPVGKKRIGVMLLIIFIILAFFPSLLVVLELVVSSMVEGYEKFSPMSSEATLLADRFLVLIGMIFAVILVTRSLTKPIYSLLKTITKVGEGKYSTRAPIISEDEIGLLTENFNDMVQELETAYQKQLEYSHTLEKNLEQLNKEIAERKQAEELARQQQKKLFQAEKMAALGVLVSGMAHEVNNPNNFILLNSDNLSDVWQDLLPFLDKYAEEHGDFMAAGLMYSEIRNEVGLIINGIKEGSERIKKIVQTLKDFARKDPGDMDQCVNIPTVIEDAVTILSGLIKKFTDNFSIGQMEKLPQIKGNIQQIEQVVINLISNACHALENRKQAIQISADVKENFLEIKVQDEGKGISAEDQKYIMDPFFTTKRDSGGTGLGLSISYNIINDHGGELLVKSEMGKGTLITIKLPVDQKKNDTFIE